VQLAFGIASSEASGIGSHSGTMTKPFHSGHGARNGVVAAMLAADGFTANPNVLDGAFFEAFYGTGSNENWQLTATLGKPFHLATPGIGVKMYPSGYHLHHPFEAALKLVKQHSIRPEQINAIELIVPRRGHFNRPTVHTGLEGKFSYQYHVAMAILDQKLTIESFHDSRALADDVQQLLKKNESAGRRGNPDQLRSGLRNRRDQTQRRQGSERIGAAAAQPLALPFAARRVGRQIPRQRGARAEGTEY
jgi:2-methylcitrate dehydratase PrpD